MPPPAAPCCRSVRTAGVALAIAAALAAGPWASSALAAPSPPSRTAPVAVRAGGAERAAAVEAARRFLCPNGGAPRRGGRCRGGNALASAASDRDGSARGWDAGLPAVTRRQAPCPAGTAQARVLFWDNAVRCVPR